MYNRKFFRSKLGRIALLSIAAMAVMNVVAWRGSVDAPAFDPAERMAAQQA